MSQDAANDTLREMLVRGLDSLGLALPAVAHQRLLDYLAQLQKWNKAYNLSGIRDPHDMLVLHLLDSLAVASHLGPQEDSIADVGTGAGLPGIPLAIACPDKRFLLIDSNSKKTRFMFQTATLLGLDNVEVVHSRVQDYESDPQVAIVVSRAFASLTDFVTRCAPLLQPDGRFLAMKGLLPEAEIAQLPPGYRVVACHPLRIPGAAVSRHLLDIRAPETGRQGQA